MPDITNIAPKATLRPHPAPTRLPHGQPLFLRLALVAPSATFRPHPSPIPTPTTPTTIPGKAVSI